ncbi:MAG: type IV toxin-antitoxin system AbiEi family antitoxin domain-containing protein [Nocardioidaceae bacterium]|nr:type IV toxin-antitoxin system AbiEi family antitoxin domain-containing protein [Nocardioidaceae bacterium]
MHELSLLHPHGVFLRRDALRFGYDDRDLRRALGAGQLVRIRHGAYVASKKWSVADPVARHILHGHAVMLSHAAPVALSHVSGAAMHGMRLWGSSLERIHVTRLGVTACRKHHDVAYHDGPSARPFAAVDGSHVLSPAECAIGAASMSSVEAGLVVVDSAYNLGLCNQDDLRTALRAMERWPGTARLQITLRLASPGAESVGESRTRFLFWAQGIPRPELQYVVRDGRELIGIVDFAWPEYGLLGEFDGRVKYGRLLKPGERPGDVVYREKIREDRIREVTGWRMIRFGWADLERPSRTAARVRGALGGR